MTDNPVIWDIDDRGIASIILNRPDRNNAYDAGMIQGLEAAMDGVCNTGGVRAVLLKGNGRHFQAGADLTWIRSVREGSPQGNLAASKATAEALDRLNRLPLPTIALVHGFCVGGGTGIVASCDIVIASEEAKFAISEVRWGLTASIIFPQLSDAIGIRQLRRYALTGERFDANEAHRIGLVHEVVGAVDLEQAGERMVAAVLENAPIALAETKQFALDYAFGSVSGGVLHGLAENHAAKRQSAEADEGLASFAEKRSANW